MTTRGARYVRSKRKLVEDGDLLITARDRARAKKDAVGFSKATMNLARFCQASCIAK